MSVSAADSFALNTPYQFPTSKSHYQQDRQKLVTGQNRMTEIVSRDPNQHFSQQQQVDQRLLSMETRENLNGISNTEQMSWDKSSFSRPRDQNDDNHILHQEAKSRQISRVESTNVSIYPDNLHREGDFVENQPTRRKQVRFESLQHPQPSEHQNPSILSHPFPVSPGVTHLPLFQSPSKPHLTPPPRHPISSPHPPFETPTHFDDPSFPAPPQEFLEPTPLHPLLDDVLTLCSEILRFSEWFFSSTHPGNVLSSYMPRLSQSDPTDTNLLPHVIPYYEPSHPFSLLKRTLAQWDARNVMTHAQTIALEQHPGTIPQNGEQDTVRLVETKDDSENKELFEYTVKITSTLLNLLTDDVQRTHDDGDRRFTELSRVLAKEQELRIKQHELYEWKLDQARQKSLRAPMESEQLENEESERRSQELECALHASIRENERLRNEITMLKQRDSAHRDQMESICSDVTQFGTFMSNLQRKMDQTVQLVEKQNRVIESLLKQTGNLIHHQGSKIHARMNIPDS